MWVQDGSYQLLHAEDGEAAPMHQHLEGSSAAKRSANGIVRSLSWAAHDPCSSGRPVGRVPLFPSSGSSRVCPGQHFQPHQIKLHVCQV